MIHQCECVQLLAVIMSEAVAALLGGASDSEILEILANTEQDGDEAQLQEEGREEGSSGYQSCVKIRSVFSKFSKNGNAPVCVPRYKLKHNR